MASFVLVHGACHTGWCWNMVLPGLIARGHRVYAPDLPGRSGDPRPMALLTLDDYAQHILEQADEPAILVGHSAGGYAISAAAEMDPAKVSRLIYLCAFLPQPGLSLTEVATRLPEPPLKGIARRQGDGYALIEEADDAALYDGLPDALRREARAHLCIEPSAPHAERIRLGANWQDCPRSYIRCTQDLAISPSAQAEMARACDPKDRYDMPAGHSPFFSHPEDLAALLHLIAEGK